MTDKVLLNSGYKKVKNDDKMFHKPIYNRKGVRKYTIRVQKLELEDETIEYRYILMFKTYYGWISARIFIESPLTIEEIEQEIDKIWTRGDFNYYES